MKLSEIITLRELYGAQTTDKEALALFSFVLDTPKGSVVEVGSASGGSTVVLLGAAEKAGKIVFSVDPYPTELEGIAWQYPKDLMKELESKFEANILNGIWNNIVQIKKEVVDCIDELPEEISLIFIDGLHEFSYVKRDFNLLTPRLVSGGMICIHDINYTKGQLTEEGGLYQCVNLLVLNSLFKDLKIIDSMLCGTKR